VTAFLARKLLGALAVAFALAIGTAALLELAPGSTCATLASEATEPILPAGCDAPLFSRLSRQVVALMTLDLGHSAQTGRPVLAIVSAHLPRTVLLGAVALLWGTVLGGAVALAQARWPRLDRPLGVLGLVAFSLPSFATGHGLQLLLGAWLPVSGSEDAMHAYMSTGAQVLDHARHLVLPAVVLGLGPAVAIARVARAAIGEELERDYVRAALARGISPWRAWTRHVLPNAALPVVALLGTQLPLCFGGAPIVETVFGFQGMGWVLTGALAAQDVPVAAGVIFGLAGVVVLSNLLADLAHAAIDPRVRLS